MPPKRLPNLALVSGRSGVRDSAAAPFPPHKIKALLVFGAARGTPSDLIGPEQTRKSAGQQCKIRGATFPVLPDRSAAR